MTQEFKGSSVHNFLFVIYLFRRFGFTKAENLSETQIHKDLFLFDERIPKISTNRNIYTWIVFIWYLYRVVPLVWGVGWVTTENGGCERTNGVSDESVKLKAKSATTDTICSWRFALFHISNLEQIFSIFKIWNSIFLFYFYLIWYVLLQNVKKY